MVDFYAVLDCESLGACPPSLQHLSIRSFCEQQGGQVSYYTCEDPVTLPHGVLRSQLPNIKTDGICFFTSKQFVKNGFDFKFLDSLLEKWDVGFSRENVMVSKDNYAEIKPWLWREGIG